MLRCYLLPELGARDAAGVGGGGGGAGDQGRTRVAQQRHNHAQRKRPDHPPDHWTEGERVGEGMSDMSEL